ncbi:MAG: hypothetical protein Q8O67_19495 [Deltaproteobacteria bacterium]|nr:hypothetical protein [Deltaproteobacteria bacterium]
MSSRSLRVIAGYDGPLPVRSGGKPIAWFTHRRLGQHAKRVVTTVAAADHRTALTVDDDGDAVLWDLVIGQHLRELRCSAGPALVADGLPFVAVGSVVRRLDERGAVDVFDVGHPIAAMALVDDQLRTWGGDLALHTWAWPSGAPLKTHVLPSSELVLSIVMDAAGGVVVELEADHDPHGMYGPERGWHRWDLETNRLTALPDPVELPGVDVGGGRRLEGRTDGAVVLLTPAAAPAADLLHKGPVSVVVADERRVVTASARYDDPPRVHDAVTGAPLWVMSEHRGAIDAMLLAGDRLVVVDGGVANPATISSWDVRARERIAVFRPGYQGYRPVNVPTPDGRFVVTSVDHGVLRLCSIDDGADLGRLGIVGGGDKVIAFSEGGRLLHVVTHAFALVVRRLVDGARVRLLATGDPWDLTPFVTDGTRVISDAALHGHRVTTLDDGVSAFFPGTPAGKAIAAPAFGDRVLLGDGRAAWLTDDGSLHRAGAPPIALRPAVPSSLRLTVAGDVLLVAGMGFLARVTGDDVELLPADGVFSAQLLPGAETAVAFQRVSRLDVVDLASRVVSVRADWSERAVVDALMPVDHELAAARKAIDAWSGPARVTAIAIAGAHIAVGDSEGRFILLARA